MASSTSHLEFTSFANVINNELRPTQQTRRGVDPSTGQQLPEVPVSTQVDVDEAVRHARAAFKPWSRMPQGERARLVSRLADSLEANGDAVQKWLVMETGKAAQTAMVELQVAVASLRGFTTIRIDDELVEDNEDRRCYVRHVPIGVGAAIVPWNWPLVLGVGKIGPALLTGNTLIVKPSPFAPYVALKVGELAAQIFPPGVLQVLSGGDDLGPMLTEHPDIDKISFTGSSQTGMRVMKSASGTLKRLTLELGGNDAAIVCKSADLDKTVPKIGAICFLSSGQICMCVKRIYVHEDIYDAFREKMVAFVASLKTDLASDKDTFVGPVQNAMQYDKVTDMYAQIAEQGWRTCCGGNVKHDVGQGKGFFFEPTLIDNPPESARIVQEEPFGPIVPMMKWRDEEDVIDRANDTKMGLGASVWTSDTEEGERIQLQLEAGSVWINSHFELDPRAPFCGHKWSGIGAEWGLAGFKGWCNVQSVWWRKRL